MVGPARPPRRRPGHGLAAAGSSWPSSRCRGRCSATGPAPRRGADRSASGARRGRGALLASRRAGVPHRRAAVDRRGGGRGRRGRRSGWRSRATRARGRDRRRRRLAYLVATVLGAVVGGRPRRRPAGRRAWAFISPRSGPACPTRSSRRARCAPRGRSLLFVPDLFGGNGVFHQPPSSTSTTCPRSPATSACCRWWRSSPLSPGSFGRRRDRRRAPPGACGGRWASLGLVLAVRRLHASATSSSTSRSSARRACRAGTSRSSTWRWPCCSRCWARPASSGAGPRRAGAGAAGVVPLALAPLLAAARAVHRRPRRPRPLEVTFGADGARRRLGRARAVARGRLALALAVGGAGRRSAAPAATGGGGGRWSARRGRRPRPLHRCSSSTGLATGSPPSSRPAAGAAAVLGTDGPLRHLRHRRRRPRDRSADRPAGPERLHQLPSVQGYGSLIAGTLRRRRPGTHDARHARPLRAGPRRLHPPAAGDALARSQFLTAVPARRHRRRPGRLALPRRARCPGTPHRRAVVLRPVASAGRVDSPAAGHAGHRRPGARRGPRGAPRPTGRVTCAADARSAAPRARLVGHASPPPSAAAGLVVAGPAACRSRTRSSLTADRRPAALDGPLQVALGSAALAAAPASGSGSATLRRATTVRPPVWLAGAAAGGDVRQVSTRPTGGPRSDVVRDAGRRSRVVRSEAYHAGLARRAPPAGGAAPRPGRWCRDGLVQAVDVPAGHWTADASRTGRRDLRLGLLGPAWRPRPSSPGWSSALGRSSAPAAPARAPVRRR